MSALDAGRPERNNGHADRSPSGIGFWHLVTEDYATYYRDPFAQEFWALFWHRFGNWRISVRIKPLRVPFTLLYRGMAKLCE